MFLPPSFITAVHSFADGVPSFDAEKEAGFFWMISS
jgi:hypothetical protein